MPSKKAGSPVDIPAVGGLVFWWNHAFNGMRGVC